MLKKYTSASANKQLKVWNDRIDYLYRQESEKMTYTEVEGIKAVKPEYDMMATRAEILELNNKVINLKHVLNVFNALTWVPELNMTIDKVLIRMAQFNKTKDRLDRMRGIQPKAVKTGIHARSNQVEYDVANFDTVEAGKQYDEICETIMKLQLELDIVNNTITFEYDEDTGNVVFSNIQSDILQPKA